MDITIIGTGNMARAIATRALAGGHTVTLLGTNADKAQALANDLSGDVRAGQVGDPLSGHIVVLAVWYQAVDDILSRYGQALDGKVVVDITNPVDPETYAPLTVAAGSVAQEIAEGSRREGRQGFQHDVRGHPRRRRGRRAPARCLPRVRRRGG